MKRNEWDPLAAGAAFLLSLAVGIPLVAVLYEALSTPAWPYGG